MNETVKEAEEQCHIEDEQRGGEKRKLRNEPNCSQCAGPLIGKKVDRKENRTMNKGKSTSPSTMGTRMPSSAPFFFLFCFFFPMDTPVYPESPFSQNSLRMLSLYRSPF